MDLNDIDFNAEFAAAFQDLENTGRNLFVTGKAGTGKSTLLQYFRLQFSGHEEQNVGSVIYNRQRYRNQS